MQMQEWICRVPADHQTCASASAVLDALAQESGAQGMLTAADWLETMLLHLASDVQAYHSIQQVIACMQEGSLAGTATGLD